MKKYDVLQTIVVKNNLYQRGSVAELDDASAKPLIDLGKIILSKGKPKNPEKNPEKNPKKNPDEPIDNKPRSSKPGKSS